MNLVVLDGSAGDVPVSQHLVTFAESMGAQVTRFALADLRLAPCLGDFECWTKTPGLCRTRDEIQDIARSICHATLVVFLTPVVFGGYSSELKKAVDRLISLAHPFFHDRDGLTRHLPRYERYASMFFVGLTEQIDDESAEIFRELATGNAINLMAPGFHTQLVSLGRPQWKQDLEIALAAALNGALGKTFPAPEADALERACAGDPVEPDSQVPPRSAVVLIGSARPKGTSTSESLARELIDNLERGGVGTTVVYASQFIKPGRAAEEALDSIMAADFLVISAPLYVDGLPTLVMRALERLSVRLAEEPHALHKVAGLLNCGYPEAVHNRIAMRLLRNFARQNGLIWAGGLALGAGEIIHGRPLDSVPFLLRAPRRALQLAANALASGQSVPAEASRLMARPLVPARVFRWIARLRWVLQARPNGIYRRQLDARPHAKTLCDERAGAAFR